MEWCETLYGELGITERFVRLGRTLIVLLMFGIIAVKGYDTGQGSLKMSAELPAAEGMTGKSAAVESAAAANITAEPAVNAAKYFKDIPLAFSVSEATEAALLMDSEKVSAMSPELPVVWTEEKYALTAPVMPEAAISSAADEPKVMLPSVPKEPEAVIPSVPEEPEAVLPSVPEEPETVLPSLPEEPETVIPSVPEEPETVIPSVPKEPEAIVPPVTDSSGNSEDSVPPAAEGFLVDESGIIYGVTDALVIADGCLVLPSEGCSGIAFGAFADAPGGIYEVYIPSNITYIAEGAFTGLFELEWFETAASGTYYTEDGVLLSEGGTCVLSFPSGRIGSYKVPASVSRFAYGAFDSAHIDTVDAADCLLTDVGNFPETILLLQK